MLAALDVCRAARAPLTARGAGTSIAGNSIGTGVVLDFSRHLNRVHSIDRETGTATIDPGIVLADLQRAAAPHGLRFGPDPSTHNRCTLGGMIGNNACGSRALGYGKTSDNVAGLDVVTGNGERLRLAPSTPATGSPTLAALQDVVGAHLATIRTEFGRFGRQVSGYSLEHLLPEHGFNVTRALVGTEGTLAVVLGATVALVRTPPATILVTLGYPDMATAADAVPALLPFHPVAVEGLDKRIVDVVVATRGPGAVPELPRGTGWLFLELSGATTAEVMDAAGKAIAASGALDTRVVTDAGEAAALWRIREDGAGLASRPMAGRRSYSGWEDAAVPADQLGSYLREFEALMTQHGVTGLPYGHFGDGCVHVRIDFPLTRPDGRQVFRGFLLDAARLVAAYGGSMSGEHGDGRARGELLPLMYSADAIAAFAAVKAVFDPDDLLNPGVIVRPAALDADLRLPAPKLVQRLAFGYADDGGDFSAAVHRCSGVGKCRADATGSGGVMCPSYLATRDEKDSTRGRARVLQEMVNGSLVTGGWRAPEVREALDLCLACKGCSSDCPTGVDMATYKAEALHQAYRGRIRPITHYSLGWLPRWARAASKVPGLANAMLDGPLAGLGKRIAGIDSRRRSPRFARSTFRSLVRRPAAGRRRPGDALGGHLHRPFHPTGGHGRGPRAGARRILGTHPRAPPLLRPDLDQHRTAGHRPEDPEPVDHRLASRGRGRDPDRRPGAVLHRGVPGRRRAPIPRAGSAPARGVGRGRDAYARRTPHRARRRSARPVRCHRRGPATLPSPRGDELVHRPRTAQAGRCRGDSGRRLLRAGRQLRCRARPPRRVGRGRRNGPATGRPGRR